MGVSAGRASGRRSPSVRRDPALRALVIFPAAATMLIGPLVPIVLPVYAATVYRDPVVLGMLVASYGLGGLGGTMLFGLIGGRVRRRTGWLIVAATWPFLYGAMATQPPSGRGEDGALGERDRQPARARDPVMEGA
jgi:MFS family permease